MALIASGVNQNGGGAASVTLNSIGAKLIVIVTHQININAVAPTDSQGNTWTPLTAYTSTDGSSVNIRAQLFYKINPTTNASHTFTFAGGASNRAMGVLVFDDDVAAVVGDTGAALGTTAATSIQPGSISPSANAVFVTAVSLGTTALSIDSSFTKLTDTAAYRENGYAYKIGSAPENPTWSTSSSFDGGTVAMAAFAPNPPNITTTTLPNGVIGTVYSQTPSVSGGTGSITWSVVSGALPTGLSMSSSGLISGTPTALGTFSFTVRATDSASAFDEQALSITITNPPPENSYDISDLVATGLAVDGDSSVIQFSRATAGVWVSDVGLFYLNQELTSIYNGTSVDTIFFVPINKTADGAVACGDTSAAVSVTGVLPDFPHYPMEWEGDRLGIVTSVARSGRVRGRVQGNGEYVRNYKLQFNNRTPSAVAEFESFFSYHYPHKKFIYRNLWHEIDATFQFNSAIKGSANSRMKGDLEVAIAQVPES